MHEKDEKKEKTNEQGDKENYEKERQKSRLRGNIKRKTERKRERMEIIEKKQKNKRDCTDECILNNKRAIVTGFYFWI